MGYTQIDMPKRGRTGWKDTEGNYLVVVETPTHWALGWMRDDLDDVVCLGGILGEAEEDAGGDAEVRQLHKLAAAAGGELHPTGPRSQAGWCWETEGEASQALATVNAGMRAWEADSGKRPWPAWARRAAAEGWTPPEGWAP